MEGKPDQSFEQSRMPKTQGTVARSSLVFLSMTFVSRIFGYLRDATIMIVFGAGGATDAFLVAFRLPNFLRRLFAEGAFTQAFVPVFAEYRDRQPQAVQTLLDRTAGTLFWVLTGITALGILLAPIIILIFAPGFAADEPKMDLATTLLQIIFPYILFISLTALAAGILNSYGYFAVPAFTPVLLNFALIAAALWLAPRLANPITALAWGVLVAGAAQLALQGLMVKRLGLLPTPRWGWRYPGVRRIMRLMSPAILGTSVVQVNLLVDVLIASFLATGSISWLYISDRFAELPVGLIGVALATVLLPRLSRCHAQNDRARFQAALNYGFRLEWLFALPCVAGLVILAEPVLVALVQYREFGAADVRMASYSMIAYALGIPAFMFNKLLNAGFFARQNTRLPVRVAVIAMLANIVLNLALVFLWQSRQWAGAHTGLALATSLAAWLNGFLLYRALVKEGYRIRLPSRWLVKIIVACAVMGAVVFGLADSVGVWSERSFTGRLSSLAGIIVVGAVVYAAVLAAQRVRWAQVAKEEWSERG